jgi:crotonobetainyl-CoA:carnitine CoA-transferase CaiB-like acyl-CoA transferase
VPAALNGIHVVNASINLPADVAGGRLTELGAAVTKVEPPQGDPLAAASEELYAALTRGQELVVLDLRSDGGRASLAGLLGRADLLLTSSRPSALASFGLAWPELGRRHPRLVHVAIVGHPSPHQELAGHDLTYVARQGLLAPPAMPRTLIADLAGAERAVSAALALLLGRAGGTERYAEVALEDGAAALAIPWRHGITTEDGPLGGSSPFYRLYEARQGFVALAALEQRFRERVTSELGVDEVSVEAFARAFRTRPAEEWERWAAELDIPLAAVR